MKLAGAIEQAIVQHHLIAEGCVVGVPDPLKGQLPFAFITLSTHDHPTSAVPDEELFREVQERVRSEVGPIATLGGMIQGKGMIPKTRSGKTLRRTLRELLEKAVGGDPDGEVAVPATIEDPAAIAVAREKIREYLAKSGTPNNGKPQGAAIKKQSKL